MSFAVGDGDDFLLKLMNLPFQSGLLLKDEVNLSFRCLGQIVVNDLIFKKHLVLDKVFSESILLFLRISFKLIQFLFKLILDVLKLPLLTRTESQFFRKEALLILEKILSIEEPFHLFAISGDLALYFVIFAVKFIFLHPQTIPGLLYFLCSQYFLLISLYLCF